MFPRTEDNMSSRCNGGTAPDENIRRAFVRCFNTGEGREVLSFLKRMTLERYLGPDCSNDALRHLEGQRHLVAYIIALAQSD